MRFGGDLARLRSGLMLRIALLLSLFLTLILLTLLGVINLF